MGEGTERLGSDGKRRRWVVVALLVGVFVGSALGAVSVGRGGDVVIRVASVVEIVTISVWMPLVYLVGAWGVGRMIVGGGGGMVWVARLGVGIAVMLSVTHLLGVFGLLTSVSAWVVSGLGIALAGVGLRRDWDGIDQAMGSWSLDGFGVGLWVVTVGAVGLMVVAACQPAGVIWDSEYGGFDSLSYHLELPRVWMERGRIWPVEWNVYSFLPSYVEGAFAHMGLLGLMGGDGLGLASGKGEGIYGAQMMGVMVTVLAALVSGSVARRGARALGLDERMGELGGAVARVLVLTTPWMVVVGTLSYNEPMVVLLTMCGVGVALETGWSVMRRAVGTAVLMGVACSCKPTALFMATPVVGVVLLGSVPVKCWWRVVLVGGCVGVVVLLPWLVRNELAAGNPVFPQMSGVFGDGHWEAGQFERYQSAHSFDGGVVDRVRLLVLPDESGTSHVERYRGLTNKQWGVTAAMGLLGVLVLVFKRETRRAGVVCAVGVGMVLVAWLGLTHVQSRFLVPMVGVFGVLGGLGVAGLGWWVGRVVVPVVLVVPVAVLGAQWVDEAKGNPNGMLIAGTGAFTGEMDTAGFDRALWWNGVNTVMDQARRHGDGALDGYGVLLVGDASAAYVRSPVVYNTVYDDWLIGDLMRSFPDDPDAWNRALVERGIRWVVVSYGELERYEASGWGDPDVTVESVVAWTGSLGVPIGEAEGVWDGGMRVMYLVGSSGGDERADEDGDE